MKTVSRETSPAAARRTDPASARQPAIEAAGLVKAFGQSKALDGFDLTVPAGSVYGVLGPNGAGKTTAIRILATLSTPDSGSARVCGHDIVREAAAVRARIALTGQFASVDEDLTGLENLRLLAWLLGFSGREARLRADELLEAFDLADAARRQVGTYSGGLRRRLDIAASLLVVPELLFLDEPTTGLDPLSRNRVWEVVRALSGAGTTVLLTTQYLDEADALADRIAVVDRGRVVAEGRPGDLKARVGSGTLRVRLPEASHGEVAAAVLGSLGLMARLDADGSAVTVELRDQDSATRVLSELVHADVAVGEFSFGQPSLDEVFLALTGTRSDEARAWERAA